MKLKNILLICALVTLIFFGNKFIKITGHAVQTGDLVSVDYEGRFSDGSVFDASSEPLTFTVGEGQLIPGFEAAVMGLEENEEVTVELSPEQGYGTYREELVTEFNKTIITESLGEEPVIGMELMTSTGSRAIVSNVTNDSVFIDLNHPLAGKNLTFWIKVVDIN